MVCCYAQLTFRGLSGYFLRGSSGPATAEPSSGVSSGQRQDERCGRNEVVVDNQIYKRSQRGERFQPQLESFSSEVINARRQSSKLLYLKSCLLSLGLCPRPGQARGSAKSGWCRIHFRQASEEQDVKQFRRQLIAP